MESQDDSIDIAKLQRIALGLSESTQPATQDRAWAITQISQEYFQKVDHTGRASPRDRETSPISHSSSRASGPHTPRQCRVEPGKCSDRLESQTGGMAFADVTSGDTQVVSQSVFDNLIKQNKQALRVRGLESADDREAVKAVQDNSADHIDLLSGFHSRQLGAAHAGENAGENEDQSSSKLGESSPTYYEPNLFPESQRFLAVPTPGSTKDCADVTTTEISDTLCNPLTADTEASDAVMALSQVFKSTQAPSSPLANNPLQADPMSDRPSPSFLLQGRLPPGRLSSPSPRTPVRLGRRSSEPHYIPVNESQAERDRLMQQRITRSAECTRIEDQSDSEFNIEPSFVQRLRRQKAIDEEANAQLSNLVAAARPLSSYPAQKRGRSKVPQYNVKSQREELSSDGEPLSGFEPLESAPVKRSGMISEEETEREEDICPTRPLQTRRTLTEEDKENLPETDLSADVSAAASSHDRLAQALAMSASQLSHDGPTVHGPTDSLLRSIYLDDQTDKPSQTFAIQDSQTSYGPHISEGCGDDLAGKSRNQEPKMDAARDMGTDTFSDMERAPLSPAVRHTLWSSPPSPARQRIQTPSGLRARDKDLREEQNFSDSYNRSAMHADARSRTNRQLSSSAPRKWTTISNSSFGMSSLRLSQVAETPAGHNFDGSKDWNIVTSIPETSPSHSQLQKWGNDGNGDINNQEDDDLPPVYSASREHADRRGLFTEQNSALEARNFRSTKILSSPSGRPRRALTEIASDLSPRMEFYHYDMDFGIFNADDQEFNSLVSTSSAPPRKKRRRNINQYASDPILADVYPTSRPQSVDIGGGKTQGKLVPSVRVTVSEETLLTQSSPLKRSQRATETYAVRQPNVRRVGRVQKSTARPSNTQKRAGVFVEAVVIQKHRNSDPAKWPSGVFTPPNNVPQTPTSTPVVAVYTDSKQPLTDGGRIMRNQVLALWPGRKRAYYAGSCYGVPTGSPPRYLVKFEDSAVIEVPISSVKRMELRIGDAVKVDRPGVPKVTRVVRGFADKLSEGELGERAQTGLIPITDVHGHCSVVLGLKQRRGFTDGSLVAEDTITVPMSNIYLDTILWNRLKEREFTYSPEAGKLGTRQRASLDEHSASTSPGSRLARSVQFTGLFSRMVFAVSYSESGGNKSRTTKLILENGGFIVKDGFNELFEYASSVPLAVPAELDPDAPADSESFRLGSAAKEIGFACLIADKHSRREKYMQALALNLPCISGRWIEDCVSRRRLLDWDMYLLPAGESMYLEGATKSRILSPSPASCVLLSNTIEGRPRLLAGQSVLLVMGRKKAEEKRKAYIFLIYALGASKVRRVLDLKYAKAVLDQQPGWDWIYVDDDEQDAARAMISGKMDALQASWRGKKRKISRGPANLNGGRMEARIMGNEILCQSLILGRLFEH